MSIRDSLKPPQWAPSRLSSKTALMQEYGFQEFWYTILFVKRDQVGKATRVDLEGKLVPGPIHDPRDTLPYYASRTNMSDGIDVIGFRAALMALATRGRAYTYSPPFCSFLVKVSIHIEAYNSQLNCTSAGSVTHQKN